MPYARDAVFMGAVVKGNGLADKTIRTYLRNDAGLLVDVTNRLKEAKQPKEDMQALLIKAIAQAAENGHPFTHTGAAGVYDQRNKLPSIFHEMGKHKITNLVQDLLNAKPPLLVKGMAKGSTIDKWLDVPNGPFARGVGEFALGADEVSDE